MGDRVSRPKQKVEPIKPILKPVMAEQSPSQPAPSTVIVVMGASVSRLALRPCQGRTKGSSRPIRCAALAHRSHKAGADVFLFWGCM